MKLSVKTGVYVLVAEKYGLKSPMTLCRYVKKAREHGLENFQFGYNNKR